MWFYPRSLCYPSSEFWPSKQGQGWAPLHSMSLNPDLLLVDHSRNFCTTYPLAHLVVRTNCKLEDLWMDCCPSTSTESLTWLLEIVGSDSVSLIVRITFIDSREFLL